MANVVVTSDSVNIIVDFGDYHQADGRVPENGTYKRSSVVEIAQWPTEKYLEITMSNGTKWYVSYEDAGQSALIVDSVNAVAPTSLSDLHSKIRALIL